MKGTIKQFNQERGYGFIRAEDGTDVFFHYSSLVMDGFKPLLLVKKSNLPWNNQIADHAHLILLRYNLT